MKQLFTETARDKDKYIDEQFLQINSLTNRGKLSKALDLCADLFKHYPDHPRVLHGFGLLNYRTGDIQEGEQLIRKSIQLKPDFSDAHHNLGIIFWSTLRLDEAEEQFRMVLEYDPDNDKALSFLASILITKDQNAEAERICARVKQLNPFNSQNYLNYGNLMLAYGRPDEAADNFQAGLNIQRSDALHSSYLFAMNLLPRFNQKDIFEESENWCRPLLKSGGLNKKCFLNNPEPGRKLRIGYVSGDFKLHPVTYYLKPVLANHNKNCFEIYLYNTFPMSDDVTESLVVFADVVRDISSISDLRAEALVRNDGIDILVDLAGHTGFNRLGLFARKPAPVQVTWLGYFNTTGLNTIDYLISDPITIPDGEECSFSEKVYKLPDCRFCYLPMPYTPRVAVLPALRNGYVTFGSFNGIHKITSDVVRLWAEVLNAVQNSKILLKSKSFQDEEVKKDFVRKFASHGISSDRIIFRALSAHFVMLQEYGDIDIALDTFPYNGGATTCEALWMGVPVVTLEGQTPISRQSKAFLHTIGCQEWVASSPESYVEIASLLASDRKSLSEKRSNLRQLMANSPLCDSAMFTLHLENAYRHMWQTWCADAATINSFRTYSIDELCAAGLNSMKDNDANRAAIFFRCILNRKPDHYEAINGMGSALEKMCQFEKAAGMYARGIRRNPQAVDSYLNAGLLQSKLAHFRKASKLFLKVLELDPENLRALINLSISDRMQERIRSSEENCAKAVALAPGNVNALGNLALAQALKGDIPSALDTLKRALEVEPGNQEILSVLMSFMFYDCNAKQSDIFEISRRIADVMDIDAHSAGNSSMLPEERQHLRIGFVSPDFCHHPVGILLVSFFREYNPERFSLFCYSNGLKSDPLTEWYKNSSKGWRDITNISNMEAAELIRKDEIDILVDLSGHTTRNRLQIFCHRPAPIQATWMGYGHTTGLDSMDFIIADDDFIQPDDEKWFSEQVMRLPHNRFCYIAPTPYPEVVEPPCLDNGFITFGSFNNTMKISEQVVGAWARIMMQVPNSRLILKYSTFKDASVRNRYRDFFAQHGVSRRRIEFREFSNPYLMLAEYGDVDIVLDPFPFTGGMTSLNALWMGVPIITLTGELPINRQTKSFLDLVGLHDLVASGVDDYVASAVALASDHARLAEIRESLRQRMQASPLCDAKRFALSVEELFCTMYQLKLKKNYPARERAVLIAKQGNYFRERGNMNTARKLFRKSIAEDENCVTAYNALGLVYSSIGELSKAMECIERALSIRDDYVEALNNKASLLMVSGDPQGAFECYNKALSITPDHSYIRSNKLLSMNYLPDCTQEQIYNESVMWISGKEIERCPDFLYDIPETRPEKLRIGFVSPDLRTHSVSYFLEQLFSNIDRKKYEIVCFSDAAKSDSVTEKFKSYSDGWHDVYGVLHTELTKIIAKDSVHILFDLAGHTSNNRLEVFAGKPAHIQVSWLGYPNTTGLTEIDYRITDEIADPDGVTDRWYTEKLVRLAGGFLCYSPPGDSPEISDFPFERNGYVTFGSFNNIAKISPEVIETWSSILVRTENSVVVLKNWYFSDAAIRTKFLTLFASHGVGPDRIIMLPATATLKEHLESYNSIDIALDTFPYNGTTTTCEALWMGVPVVTFAGDHHASRVGASILSHAGFPELVGGNRSDYVDITLNAARDIVARSGYRKSVRERFQASSLCDGKKFSKSFEKSLEDMWKSYSKKACDISWR